MNGRDLNGSTYRMMESESDRILHSMVNTLRGELEEVNKDVDEVKTLLRWVLGVQASLLLTIIGALISQLF